MKPPARIRLRLLGRLALAYNGEPGPIRLSTRKAGALIAYLAMSPEQTASREELATLLWGGCSDQQARASLRQALVLLRKDLRWSHFIMADAAVVRLQPGLWSVDAGEFEDLSTSSDPKDLARAADLFGGEFLTGLNIDEEGFDEWVSRQRQRVQLAASRLCETYAARPDLVSDGQQAVAVVERLLALDPLREDWQRLALTLYARYRGKNEALAQAEIFAATLQRELGVTPEKETRALVEKIRASEAAAERGPIAPPAPPAMPSRAAPADQSFSAPDVPADTPPAWMWIRPRGRAAALLALGCVIALGAISLSIYPWRPADRDDHALRGSSSIERWRPPGAADARLKAAIAVLPFVAQGSTSLQPAADAITDDLINMLARVPAVRVISRQTMESYRGQAIDVAAVAADLDVSYVLEGVVRAEGGRLRVNVELIDPATRSPAWSTRIERAAGEESEVRDEIVTQLARELQLGAPVVEAAQAPEDPNLRQLYQQGWAAIYASGRAPEMLRQAEVSFSRALAESPQSRWAKIGLANAHALAAALAIDADGAGHLAKAEEILAPLVAKNPNGAGPHFAMGVVHVMRGRPTEAILSFRRVIAVNPSHAPSYAGLGHALIFAGKADEGLDYIRYALRLSPRDVQRAHWLRFAAEAELELGHSDRSLDLVHQSLAVAPRQPQTLRLLAIVLAAAGRADEAHRALAEMRAVNPAISDQRLMKQAELYRSTRPEFLRGTQRAIAPAEDPWQPPAPADEKAAAGKPNGLTAILVLPFTSVGEPSERSTLSADLMTDDLTNALSRTGGFRVISRQTAMSYRGHQVDPAAVGTELGVHYVLEGSVEAQDSDLRANVELIDTRSRSHVWSGSYDRTGTDRTMILDDVVKSLGRELQIKITRAEGAVAAQDPDVHALIYKGFAAMADTGRVGQPALERSRKYFTDALAREPENPRALTGLGMYHVQMAVQLFAPDPAPHLAKGEAILQQVIAQHPDVGGPYRLMGVLEIARGRAEIAAQWLQREIALNPSDAPAYAQFGRTMVMRGHVPEGMKYILYAMRLSPHDQAMAYWLSMAGTAEFEQGHDQKAIEYLDRALSLKPGHPRALMVLAALHALGGNLSAARSRLEEVRRALPHLSGEKLIDRYFGGVDGGQSPRLREGLTLALTPPVAAASASPGSGIR